MLFLAQCKKFGWNEEAEEIIGRLYLDFNTHYGRILINDPTPTDIVDYLLMKDDNPIDVEPAFVQNPTELLSVILIGAAMFDLDHEFDSSLIQLDHSSFAFYIPENFMDFQKLNMEDGITLIFQLGHGYKEGYGIWSVQDRIARGATLSSPLRVWPARIVTSQSCWACR